MHELGVLKQALGRVQRIAEENRIEKIRCVAFEVGEASGIVPAYFQKLYPLARELFPALVCSELKMDIIPGSQFKIKEIAY